MSRDSKPIVTIVHTLPGRVRLRLSRPLADPEAAIAFLREHAGMGAIGYTPRTGSLLVRFDPHAVTAEEITLRVAFRFALDQGARPVRLLAAPEQAVLQNSAVLAGLGLAAAVLLRWLNPREKDTAGAQWLAGLATAWSVADHGWREFRTRGYFDPEVLALAYLAAALVRGNVLGASVVTWLATFGRHLAETSATGAEVQAIPIPGPPEEDPRYELAVGPDVDAPDRMRLGIVGMLNSALKYAMTGGGAHGLRSLWDELRDVSRVHGEVLEGYGRHRGGIPIRFR
ncbi:MAG: hypothetical protein RBS80_29585 [Thermoguttaceae bacterium]|jgi:hypothetical protein|nr:hypothetical protein [Thermoguttaceae bacterium]